MLYIASTFQTVMLVDLKTSAKGNRRRQHEEKKMRMKVRYEERLIKADATTAPEVSA